MKVSEILGGETLQKERSMSDEHPAVHLFQEIINPDLALPVAAIKVQNSTLKRRCPVYYYPPLDI